MTDIVYITSLKNSRATWHSNTMDMERRTPTYLLIHFRNVSGILDNNHKECQRILTHQSTNNDLIRDWAELLFTRRFCVN